MVPENKALKMLSPKWFPFRNVPQSHSPLLQSSPLCCWQKSWRWHGPQSIRWFSLQINENLYAGACWGLNQFAPPGCLYSLRKVIKESGFFCTSQVLAMCSVICSHLALSLMTQMYLNFTSGKLRLFVNMMICVLQTWRTWNDNWVILSNANHRHLC